MGPASGRSTIAAVLLRLDHRAGAYHLAGRDDLGEDGIRGSIAAVDQQDLFDTTIEENLRLANGEYA